MGDTVAGGCLCAEVQFALELPVKWVAHCHCSMCRRAHGAGYVTWVGVPTAQLRVTRGADRLVRYRSSAEATRSFCNTCGSTLFFESTRWPGEIHVARANVTGALPPPQAHAFYSDRADWIRVGDHLPRRGGTTGTEPLPDDDADPR